MSIIRQSPLQQAKQISFKSQQNQDNLAEIRQNYVTTLNTGMKKYNAISEELNGFDGLGGKFIKKGVEILFAGMLTTISFTGLFKRKLFGKNNAKSVSDFFNLAGKKVAEKAKNIIKNPLIQKKLPAIASKVDKINPEKTGTFFTTLGHRAFAVIGAITGAVMAKDSDFEDVVDKINYRATKNLNPSDQAE